MHLSFFQENNAIAVVDLNAEEIIAVHGLGFKDWSVSEIDPSDRDDGMFTAFTHGFVQYLPAGLYTLNCPYVC